MPTYWNNKRITEFINWYSDYKNVDLQVDYEDMSDIIYDFKKGIDPNEAKKPKPKLELTYKDNGIDDNVLINVKRLLNSSEWTYKSVYNHGGKTCLNALKFTKEGKRKVSYRVEQLKDLKKQLLKFYQNTTGLKSYHSRKQQAVIFRNEAIKKLYSIGYSVYEITYIFDKDRSTIYYCLDNYKPEYYSDDWKKYITKVKQDIDNLNWSVFEWKYL
jgi:hypothetical protein